MRKKKIFAAQSLIEVALILPMVLLLITGFLDLGRAVFYYSALSNMVREGARFAIVDTDSQTGPYLSNVQYMNEFTFAVPDVSETPTSSGCYPTCIFEGQDIIVVINRLYDASDEYFELVTVEAIYMYKPITPGIIRLLNNPDGIELRAQSTMRIAGAAR